MNKLILLQRFRYLESSVAIHASPSSNVFTIETSIYISEVLKNEGSSLAALNSSHETKKIQQTRENVTQINFFSDI